MVWETGLTTDYGAVADLGTASQADLGHNQAVGSDCHIVADLNQIIQFGASTDPGLSQRAAIDAGTRPDLDIIFDHYTSDGIDANEFGIEAANFAGRDSRLDAAWFGRHISKAISSDRGICLNDHPATNLATVAYSDAGVKKRLFADHNVGADADMSHQSAMIGDLAARTYPAKGPDRHVLADGCARVNDGARMHPRVNVDRSIEKLQKLCQDQPRAFYHNLVWG